MKWIVFHPSLVQRLVVAMVLLVTFCLIAQGQTWTQYDQGTPPQHAAGVSPLGSYLSTDIGTVNLSNGSLNISLPLGTVGGRGFSLPITLNFSSKVWSAAHDTTYHPVWDTDVGMAYARYGAADHTVDMFNRVAPGWTIGGIPLLRKGGSAISPCTQGYYLYSLTTLTVVLPDKGEIKLRDDLNEGVPLYAGCSPTFIENRGQRWHATDGSGIIFVSDNANGVVNNDFAGTLITPDGTRYRFQNVTGSFGRCASITDRNGNRITINRYTDPLDPAHITTDYTDQLGRTVKVEQNALDPANPSVALALLVTIKGYLGATQYLKVKTDFLSNNIRADIGYTGGQIVTGNKNNFGYCGSLPPGTTELFTGSYCEFQERIDNKKQVTELILPDNRSLQFKYNLYGEVAEVSLPTGGKLQYGYTWNIGGLPSGNSLPFEYQGQLNSIFGIDRVVSERRTYPDGVNLEGSTTYGFGPQTVNGTSYACAEVKSYQGPSATGALFMWQRHFFLPAGRYLTGNSGGGAFGTGYSLWSTGVEWRAETLDAGGGAINAVEQNWTRRAAISWPTGPNTWVYYSGQEQLENDNRVNQTRKYLDNGSFAKTEIIYDSVNARANNVKETKEYDFDQALKRRTVTSYLTTNPDNGNINYSADDIFLLRLPTQQSIFDSGGTERARTVYQYDKYADDGNNAALTDYGPSVTGHDAAYGPGRTARGNVTAVGRWLDTDGSTLFTYSRYDTLGNVVSTKDPRGNVTAISYADNFGDGDNPDSGAGGDFGPTFALPTLITSPPPNPGQQQHTAKSQYDFNAGLLTGFKDRNGVITKTEYNDPFNRPTRIINAKGVTGVETQTAMYYAPQSNPYGVALARSDALTAKDRDAAGDGVLRSWTVTDGFGRAVESWTRHPQGDVKVSTTYDGLGRVSQTSNPYRNGETPVYTTTTYDLAGRVTAATTPDGATVSTAYNGNQVTVTDQAGKKRRSETDALGRLAQVVEDPDGVAYQTDYSYDTLGNLTEVNQGGQHRYFFYDSLGRLARAKNPEQSANSSLNLANPPAYNNNWSLAYSYDANGNLVSKTDARNITTSYTYDALNRNTSVDYSNTTVNPDITRYYDNPDPGSYGKGRYWHDYAGGSWSADPNIDHTAIDSYDPLGRPLTKRQLFKRNSVVTGYSINQTYDLAGNIKAVTYPSGRTVNYSYDQAGRLSSFTGNLGDGQLRTYSTITQYHPAGMIERETFGTQTPLYHKKRYNSRLQLGDLRLSAGSDALSYDRGALLFFYGPNAVASNDPFANDPTNNGNLVRQAHYVPIDGGGEVIPQADNYTYDALNRISGVVEPNVFTQTYGYDEWGNRWITSATGGVNNYNPTYDQATNRINGLGYDAAGNITSDPMTGGIMTYDAENRMLAATNVGVSGSYTYNADGRRVRRITGGQEMWYVYGIGGELLAEYAHDGAPSAPLKEYGYRDGQILIIAESGSGGGVSLVKPPSQSRSDLIGKIGPGTGGAANRIFSAYEPFADLGINKGYGSIATDFSGSDNAGTLVRGGPRTTAEEYGNAPSANDAGVESLAEHPADAAPSTPQKEYGARSGLSIVAAPSVDSVSPGANQTPDPGQSGTLGVDGISNTGHGSTQTNASAVDIESSPSKNISQAKSARWSSFQGGPSGSIIGLKLKFDWTASGNVYAFVDTGGIASARIDFNIDYSIDGGSSWVNALSRSRMVSQSGTGEKTDGISDGGSVEVVLSPSQNISLVQVRDIMRTNATANAPSVSGAQAESSAGITTSVSIISLEVETDTTAPVISSVAAGGITTTGATITWATNENSDSQVEYGPTTAYGQSTTLDPALVTAHSQVLSGLTLGILYHYRVKSRDAVGNLAVSEDFTFTTADTTAPVISNVAAGGITSSRATITWTTDENSDSQVEYGLTTAYGQSTTLNATLVTAHSQSLSGLTAETVYHYRVKSRDAGGNLAVSGDFTFTTAPLVISNVAAGGITATGATITWTTNENSDSQVEYGPTTAYGQSTTLDPALVTAHSQVLSGLTAGTLYHYRVKSRDAASNLAVSGDFTFTTAQNGSGVIKWLVTDHLGSTRIVIDETGSLGGIKRHDYGPFGEELSAGVGIRSASLGYGPDSTRQKFTGKERDDETGLDYFGARYYASLQGRFTSPDPLGHWMLKREQQDEYIANPQRWNRYTYVLNNPLRYTDPNGMADIPAWNELDKKLREDLAKRKIDEATWNSWGNDKRQAILNARAVLIVGGVWDNVTSIGFASFSYTYKIKETNRGTIKEKIPTGVTPDNKAGWEVFFTTDKDIRPTLEMHDYFSEDPAGNHPEGKWTEKQKGKGIVNHVVGLKWGNNWQTDHFDAGGGGWSLEHGWDVIMNTGPNPDKITSGLAGTPAAQYLKGISPSMDKLLTQKK